MKFLIAAISLTLTTNIYAQSNLSLNKEPASGSDEAGVSSEVQTTALTSLPGVEESDTREEYPVNKALPDGIMLYRTKMVIVKDGVMKPITADVVLPNGTRVRKDGFVFQKNKYKVLLNLDEFVDMTGKIRPIPVTTTQIKQF
jgi:hypothetical protein